MIVKKLPFWATLLTFLGICALCALGVWQLQRLHWKQAILETIEQEYTHDASAIPLRLDDISRDVLLKRGTISGSYQHDKEVLIAPRVYDGIPGYHVITPFIIEGGGSILVNRGWIPVEAERDETFSIQYPEGKLVLQGSIRSVSVPSRFVPQNKPDKNKWYRLDVKEIGASIGLFDLFPNVFYLESVVTPVQSVSSDYPVVQNVRPKINNNHAQYAAFWFAMAVALFVIYVLRFIVPQKGHQSLVDE